MTLPRVILLLLAIAALLMLRHYYEPMPETMASHFDGAGRPNSQQPKEGFFLLSGAMVAMVVVLFVGFGQLFRRLPPKRFNLPNRDYWLAPGRRDATIDFMARQMEWFGVASMLLLILVLHAVFTANLRPERNLDVASLWWILGLYFLYTTLWVVRFITHFRRPVAP